MFLSSFDSDRDLQELLALERLYHQKGKRPSKDEDMDRIPIRKTTGVVDWQVEIIRQVLKKHRYERQVCHVICLFVHMFVCVCYACNFLHPLRLQIKSLDKI